MAGRVSTFRSAGKALIFMDIIQDGHGVQVIFNRGFVGIIEPVSEKEFYQFARIVQRGDIICESESMINVLV